MSVATGTRTERLTRAYVDAYRFFARELVEPKLGIELTDPILTFSHSPRRNAVAFFIPDGWRGDANADERVCEIALVQEHTAREPRDLFASLVHEMVHYVDHLEGTAPKTNGYHGRAWFERMKKIGLPARALSKSSKIAVTHDIDPAGVFAKVYDRMPDAIRLPFVAAITFEYGPDGGEEEPDDEPKTKSGRRFKYECPKCKTTMRGPTGRKLICGDCNKNYEEEGVMPAPHDDEHDDETAA